eukprot:1149530-Pelagomonas_calceolata.AAC.3
MKIERHNAAGRMDSKAHSERPWGAGLVNIDLGIDDRLARHDLQIPARPDVPVTHTAAYANRTRTLKRMTPCVTQQACHLAEDQHSYPR